MCNNTATQAVNMQNLKINTPHPFTTIDVQYYRILREREGKQPQSQWNWQQASSPTSALPPMLQTLRELNNVLP